MYDSFDCQVHPEESLEFAAYEMTEADREPEIGESCKVYWVPWDNGETIAFPF